MSSWKKYGGVDNFDKSNHVTVNSIVADYFTVKKQFVGDFDICGNLISHKQLIVDGSASIYGKLNTRSVDISGDLAVNDITCRYNGSFNNLTVNNDLNMSNNQFMHGDVSGIGINNRNPKATLDISGNNISSVNVYTAKNKNRNILAHNSLHNGIVLWADNSNVGIDFFVTTDISVNNTGFDGRIQYDDTGNLLLDADNYVNILPQLVISDFSADIVYNNSIVTIHGDNSSNLFNYDSYKNKNAYVQNAITTVVMDNSSVMFVNFIKPDKTGFSIAGGSCPYDSERVIGSFGFNDLSSHTFTANQTIVSGKSTIKYKTTTGINTYKPIVDKYVLDINGPVHIRNGENNIVARSRSIIPCMKFNRANSNIGIAIAEVDGSNNPVFYTNNGGKTWNSQNLFNVQTDYTNTVYELNTLFVYDSSYTFAIGNSLNVFYTYNGGLNWIYFSFNIPLSPKSIYICNKGNNSARFFITANSNTVINELDRIIYFDASFNAVNNSVFFADASYGKNIGSNQQPVILENTNNSSMIDGYGDFFYVVGNKGVYKYRVNNPSNWIKSHQVDISTNLYYKYNAISVFDTSYVVAVGDRILSYTKDGGDTWTDLSYQFQSFHPQWYNFTSVNILDQLNAIAVSDNGKIAYTNDGSTWKDASASTVFNLSGSEKMLDGSLNNVTIINKDSFILTNSNNANIDYNTNIVYNYFPELFNHANNNVMDVSGNMNIYGNLTIVPDNTNTIQLSANATTCNFLTEVTNMYIGKSDSNATFNGKLTVIGTLDARTVKFSNTELAYLVIDPTSDTDFLTRNIKYALDISNSSVKIDKDLDVSGNVAFGSNTKNFIVRSSSFFNNTTTFNGTVNISLNTANALSIAGNTLTNGAVVIYNPNQAMNINNDNGALFVNGHAKVNKNLFVMQNMLIYGSADQIYSLDIKTGNIKLNDNVIIQQNNMYVNCNAAFGGIMTISSANVDGIFTVNSGSNNKLVVNSDASFTGDVFIGTTNIKNDGTIISNKDVSFNGNLFVNKDVSFNGNLFVNKDVSFNGNIYFGNSIIKNDGTLTMNRDASFNGNIYFGNSVIKNDGTLTMNRDASFNGNMYINNVNGSILVVNRDASFNGNIYFGNSVIKNDGTLTMNRDASFNGIVQIGSNTSFDANGNLTTRGNISLNNLSINLTGSVQLLGQSFTINTPITFVSGVTFGSNLSATQQITVNLITTFNNTATFNSNTVFNSIVTNANRTVFASDVSFTNANSTVTFDNSATVFNSNVYFTRPVTNANRTVFASDVSFTNANSTVTFDNSDTVFNSNAYFTRPVTNANRTVFASDVSFTNPDSTVTFDNSATVFNSIVNFTRPVNSVYTISSSSDYRIKTNVLKLSDTSFTVDLLNPIFYYNTQTKKKDIGFIAHELQEHFPFLVNGEKDGDKYQSVNYNGLIGMLVREVQELKRKVKNLESMT